MAGECCVALQPRQFCQSFRCKLPTADSYERVTVYACTEKVQTDTELDAQYLMVKLGNCIFVELYAAL